MKTKPIEYDGTNLLKTPEDIEEYLRVAFEDGDPKLITRALGNVAKAQNLSATARKTGLNRAGLFRSLSDDGDPKLSTLTKVMDSFGYQLSFSPKSNRQNYA